MGDSNERNSGQGGGLFERHAQALGISPEQVQSAGQSSGGLTLSADAGGSSVKSQTASDGSTVFAVDDIVVDADNPLVVGSPGGGPVTVLARTVRIKAGGQVTVHSPLHMYGDELTAEPGDGDTTIRVVGQDGVPGMSGPAGQMGPNGAPGAPGGMGGNGGPGMSGSMGGNANDAVFHYGTISGLFTVINHGGTGGAGGRGGPGGNGGQGGQGGGAGGNGGQGGPGGNGGDGGNGGSVTILYDNIAPGAKLQVLTPSSPGGEGGAGGPGGQGGQGSPNGSIGHSGNPGTPGRPGAAGSVTFKQSSESA